MVKESPFHAHALNVTGFLGGITFAAMILIIESKDKFVFSPPESLMPLIESIPMKLNYAEQLINLAAISSVLFIVSTVGLIRLAAGEKDTKDKYSRFMEYLASAGFIVLIMILLPALVLPFSLIGAIVVFIIGIIMLFGYSKYV